MVEVKLTTLGYWYKKTEDNSEGKFINYHAGPAPEVVETEYPQLISSNEDPLFALTKYLTIEELTDISKELNVLLKEEIS
jgi:hypothetical protein